MPKIEIPNIVFARHGAHEYGHEGLSATGILQAEALATKLEARFSVVDIYSSKGPLAVECAAIVGARLGRPTHESEDFTPVDALEPRECLPRAIEFLAAYTTSAEAICIIARGQVVKSLLGIIGKNALGVGDYPRAFDLGEARVLNTERFVVENL